MKDRAGGRRDTTPTPTARPSAVGQPPPLLTVTQRAPEAVGPAQPVQVVQARPIIRKPAPKIRIGPRVVDGWSRLRSRHSTNLLHSDGGPISCILTRPRGVHRTRGTRMPEPCSPVELALVEFQIAGGAQGAVGELQPQRLIDADAIAAASAYEGRSVVVHEGDALEALTRTRLCPTVRRPLCPGSGLLRTFCGDLRFHARWFRRLPGRPRGSWLGRPGEARRPAGRIGGSWP